MNKRIQIFMKLQFNDSLNHLKINAVFFLSHAVVVVGTEIGISAAIINSFIKRYRQAKNRMVFITHCDAVLCLIVCLLLVR